MTILRLNKLELKTFTEQNAEDYCNLNNIDPDNIIELRLRDNKLTDISGIKIFENLEILNLSENRLENIYFLKDLKNIKRLYLNENPLWNISVIKYLTKLEYLNIAYLELESNQIQYINNIKSLQTLSCHLGFKDMNITNKLNKNIEVFK